MNSNEGNTNHTRIRRKKDPKSMTIEELEDYIQRNRSTANKSTNESKSLNNSFQCLHTFNFIDNSYTNTNSNQMNTTSNPTSNHKKERSEERINISSPTLKIKTDSNEGSELKRNNVNLSFKELPSPYNINTIQTNKNNNSKDKREQYEEKKSNYGERQSPNGTPTFPTHNTNNTNTISNPITNLNSKAASNYLKTLQDKINQQAQENDELKRNFISISELYEKEKEKNNKMLYYESNNNNNNTIDKSTESLSQFNLKEKEELQLKISMQATNISLLEKEKMRHLEQNSIEKAENENKIDHLNKKIQSMTKENEGFKRELIHLRDINDEFDKFKKQFEEERSEMIETMKSLREIIFQKENEKNALAKQYDTIIQELNDKIEQLTHAHNGNISQMENSNTFSSIKKSKTTHSNINPNNTKQRYKTKDKQIPTKLNNNHNQSSSSLSTMNTTKKQKRQKTPKRKNSKQHLKMSIPIKSMAGNTNKMNQLQYQNQQQQIEFNNEMNINNQNALFKPGELSSIRSDYEYNNNANRYNNNCNNNSNWMMSGRNERINDYEEQLNQINESIFALERNLPEITRDYKNILSRLNCNLFPEETITLKNNLNILGATIEEHNNQLMQLKSQQQDILKNYLSQGGNLN